MNGFSISTIFGMALYGYGVQQDLNGFWFWALTIVGTLIVLSTLSLAELRSWERGYGEAMEDAGA